MAMLPNPLPRLAGDPTGTSLGLRLPPGTLVDTTCDRAWHEPLLWFSDGPADTGTWQDLRAGRSAGLHPVLIEADADYPKGPAQWELAPADMSYPGDHDAEDVLADLWIYGAGGEDDEEGVAGGAESAETAELAELSAPYGPRWPGVAPAAELGAVPGADPDEAAERAVGALVAAGRANPPHAALVYARRSADIPAAVGWMGAANLENDTARLCAVLRSWEDRFGIRVVALGFDTLTLSVASPVRTREAAEAVAAEHLSFCPDNITQGAGSLRAYAGQLVDASVWRFWWD